MNNQFRIDGKIVHIDKNSTQVTDKFSKREFVINTNEKYPQSIKFQFVNDGCDRLDNFVVGEDVYVDFQLRGRQHKESYFTNLQAIFMANTEPKAEPIRSVDESNTVPQTAEDDGLPF